MREGNGRPKVGAGDTPSAVSPTNRELLAQHSLQQSSCPESGAEPEAGSAGISLELPLVVHISPMNPPPATRGR